MSKTSLLIPNSLTSIPKKNLAKRLSNSPAYLGKRNKLRFFLNQLKNKLNGNINRYPNPNS